MNQCQIRVITNGYILAYMDGAEFVELCFETRERFFEHLNNHLHESKHEELGLG